MEQQYVGVTPDALRVIEELESQRKAEDARVLTSEDFLGDFSFFSWGYSEPLKITRNGKVEFVRIPIKSFGIADITEAYQANMPSPPTSRVLIKKGSPEARELGLNHDKYVDVANEADPKYLADKRKHDNELGQETVLRGIGIDLYWEGKVVLKGTDMKKPNEIIDRELALKAFRKMGFTLSHFTSIVKSIRELTQDAEVDEEANLSEN